ncbi:MAG: GTP 3',8-cyclase MoaA [Candidatus Melainabacteria bacterium]|nr:MAG: GTP 3',8-cyclase MoaA [Candidatus Melainabacteria bacterium]
MNRLIDNFGRKHNYLRISVTDRCNLRCQYCMPHEGIAWKKKDQLLTFEEIIRISRVFARMGVDKIRLTGGEPLVRRDLEVLIEQLALIDGVKTLAMTTNATLLKPLARHLKSIGLTALNISLDTLREERFAEITRRDDFYSVMDGLNEALEVGFDSLKLNMVVMSGINDDEVMDFVDFARDKALNVRFIEYMPFKDNQWKSDKVVTFQQMREQIQQKYNLYPLSAEPSAVAKDFGIDGYPGTVSFISSMSDSFCGTCNRLRLTADGSIKSCLFYPAETSLRDELRRGITDEYLEELILQTLALKPEAHPPAEEIAAENNRAMIEIGG